MADSFQTPRLTLRRMEYGDAQALHVFFSDPVAMEFWSAPHESFEDTTKWVRGTVDAPAEETCEFVLVLDGVTIGKAGIWKKPELGYFLTRAHWGQGLMTEALRVLIPHLHEAMDLPVMKADITPENVASARLLTKMGFTETRRAQNDHWDGQKWCDTAYFERHRDAPIS